MSNVKEYDELNISQLPAIEVLSALGYSYLSPTEAERQRGNLYNVLLTEVLQNQLNALNGFTYCLPCCFIQCRFSPAAPSGVSTRPQDRRPRYGPTSPRSVAHVCWLSPPTICQTAFAPPTAQSTAAREWLCPSAGNWEFGEAGAVIFLVLVSMLITVLLIPAMQRRLDGI